MLRCTGCGSTDTIEQIRFKYPQAISCCPERVMVEEPEPQTVTIFAEVILGGIRFDAGTYEIRRVSEPPADETPF